MSLPPSSVPTMALPFVLVPSAALSHYPLVASGVQQTQTSDNPSGLRFSLPTMMSPAAFMVGTAPHSVMEASDVSVQHLPSAVAPELGRHHVSAAGTPRSPAGPRQNVGVSTPEPLVWTGCRTSVFLFLLLPSSNSLVPNYDAACYILFVGQKVLFGSGPNRPFLPMA